VLEHALSFERFSRFPVWSLNTSEGFPRALADHRFKVVVLHYSLFGSDEYQLNEAFLEYLRANREGLRVGFFQDESYYTRQRFAFIDDYRLDWVYTLLQPAEAARIYGSRTHGPRLFSTIPGFVGDDLLRQASRFARPQSERNIDIGYRARTLPFYMGRGAQEKSEISRRFVALTGGMGLRLDIAIDEASRLYGDAWYRFLGSCRAVLGVEAGVSIFDVDGEARAATEDLLAREPDLSFEEVSERILERWEDNVFYRTVSPRHFEAAAFDTCQILFEGSYSGVLEAGTHYIPLRKDFANLDEVIRSFRDVELRSRIVSTARRDLIESGRYSYATFVRQFDGELESAGALVPGPRQRAVDEALSRGAWLRRTERRMRTAYWRLRLATRRALVRS
ncbi:MAG: hypothetical protein ACRDFR_02925, partial [Candidatus Limnocylindria bacterium]